MTGIMAKLIAAFRRARAWIRRRKYRSVLIIFAMVLPVATFAAYRSFPEPAHSTCDELRWADEWNSRSVLAADLRSQILAERTILDGLDQRLETSRRDTAKKIVELETRKADLPTNVDSRLLVAKQAERAAERLFNDASLEHELAQNEIEDVRLELESASAALANADANVSAETVAAEEIASKDDATAAEIAEANQRVQELDKAEKEAQQRVAAARDAESKATERAEMASSAMEAAQIALSEASAETDTRAEEKVSADKETSVVDVGAAADAAVEAEDDAAELQAEIESVGEQLQRLEDEFERQSDQVNTIRTRLVVLNDAMLHSIDERLETLRNVAQKLENEKRDSELASVIAEIQGLVTNAAPIGVEIEALRDQLGTQAVTQGPILRSTINIQPVNPIETLKLGSDRKPRRIEVMFANSATTAIAEGLDVGSRDEVEVALPEKAIFEATAGRLSQSNGDEIPPESIAVWTRRIGSELFLSICISPSDGLPAGDYKGSVYLTDPTLDVVKVPVHVTAQFQWIDLLYGLLLILPCMAIAYVWYTGRIAAGADPWDWPSIQEWIAVNFLLLFVVGSASVWAALQVAFSNPSWGATGFGSTAVFGASLVAAVTAVTAVAGKVVGHERRQEKKDKAATNPPTEQSQ